VDSRLPLEGKKFLTIDQQERDRRSSLRGPGAASAVVRELEGRASEAAPITGEEPRRQDRRSTTGGRRRRSAAKVGGRMVRTVAA